jgi:O-acetyl-ADP-ribose deacetylase
MSEILEEIELAGGKRLSLREGDLTAEPVDAIVNAANQHLQHGGGLAGAISQKGGPEIQRESNAIGFTATGTAAVTSGGNLPAKHVIHAVGPIYANHEAAEAERLLASAVEAALEMGDAVGAKSIALPAISSGIFGYPKRECAKTILDAMLRFTEQHPESGLEDLRIVLMGHETIEAFRQAWRERIG